MDLAFGAVENTTPRPGTRSYSVPSIPLSEQTTPRPQPPADWEPWKIWAPGTKMHGMVRASINPADWIKVNGKWVHVTSLPQTANSAKSSTEYQAAKIADAAIATAKAKETSDKTKMLLGILAVVGLYLYVKGRK